jgi:hypothetical protein
VIGGAGSERIEKLWEHGGAIPDQTVLYETKCSINLVHHYGGGHSFQIGKNEG